MTPRPRPPTPPPPQPPRPPGPPGPPGPPNSGELAEPTSSGRSTPVVRREPAYADDAVTVWHGDCLDVLPTLPDASIDAVCTDPPYGLEFMGRDWDGANGFRRSLNPDDVGRDSVFGRTSRTSPEYRVDQTYQRWCEQWAAECLRVLKPGGHLLAFGGTRTVHRLTCAIEDAGFEIRDGIDWLYGNGFPKSLDVSKAIDRQRQDNPDWQRVGAWLRQRRVDAGMTAKDLCAAIGAHGQVNHGGAVSNWENGFSCPTWEQWNAMRSILAFVGDMDAEVWRLNGRKGIPGEAWQNAEVIGIVEGAKSGWSMDGRTKFVDREIKAPATDDARRWSGWGTALKPAHEPIVVARKPLQGTVAGNVLEYGTGAINVDAARVGDPAPSVPRGLIKPGPSNNREMVGRNGEMFEGHPAGRWPTNVVLSHAGSPDGEDLCVDGCVPGCPVAELDRQSGVVVSGGSIDGGAHYAPRGYEHGTGSRRTAFHAYSDRGGASRFFPVFRYQAKADAAQRPRVQRADGTWEAHSTVKPLELLRWMVRLVTPPGGVVLDPFLGSGTTAEACLIEGFRCIGVEREPCGQCAGGCYDHIALIRTRLSKPLQPVLGDFGAAS